MTNYVTPDTMINNYFEIDKQGNLKKRLENLIRNQRLRKIFSQYLNINVGYSLVTPILIGVIVGLVLDNKFHSKPYFTVFLFFWNDKQYLQFV